MPDMLITSYICKEIRMDAVLQALLSWQFVLFCLAISALVFVVRKFVEYAMENWISVAKESKFWKELILPILPITLGTVCALLAKKYPYPDGLTTISARVAFGLVAGLLSGLVYRVTKASLTSKLSSLISSLGVGSSPVAPSATRADPNATTKNIINNG